MVQYCYAMLSVILLVIGIYASDTQRNISDVTLNNPNIKLLLQKPSQAKSRNSVQLVQNNSSDQLSNNSAHSDVRPYDTKRCEFMD